MNKLVLSPHFRKAYKKIVGKIPLLQEQIDSSIKLLEKDIYDVKLKTHKLSGELLAVMLVHADMIVELFLPLKKMIMFRQFY